MILTTGNTLRVAMPDTYGFLASILPYSVAAWEKLSIFLNS